MGFKTFSVNEYLTTVDVNAYLAQQQVARKSATESVTSSISPQTDDHLFMTLNANTTYWLDGLLLTDGAAAGDFRLQFIIPSGTIRWLANGLQSATAATVDIVDRNWKVGGTTTIMGTVAAGTTTVVHVAGIIRVGSTGGQFRLDWAQGTSSGTATRLFVNSFLRCVRMRP